jgi:hypothetical protein
VSAGHAAKAHEAVAEQATLEVGSQLTLYEAGDRAVPLLGVREECLDVLAEDGMEHAVLGFSPRAVALRR